MYCIFHYFQGSSTPPWFWIEDFNGNTSFTEKNNLSKIHKGKVPTAKSPKQIHLYSQKVFFILKLYNDLCAEFLFLPEFYRAHDKTPIKISIKFSIIVSKEKLPQTRMNIICTTQIHFSGHQKQCIGRGTVITLF